MRDEGQATNRRIGRGALAGAIAGIVASFAMDRFQALTGPPGGDGDDQEPATAKAADGVVQAIGGGPIRTADQPLAGQAVHYALGIALGAAYGIAAEFRPQVTAGYGTGFALSTAALLDEVAVPATGLAPPPWRSGIGTHAYGLASHLVFGVVTELVRRQVDRAVAPKG